MPKTSRTRSCALSLLILVSSTALLGEAPDPEIRDALKRAGENRDELVTALEKVPSDQREGLVFLIGNMPERDLEALTAEFLLENTAYSYRVLREVPWGKRIPKDVFLNHVLPYANVNERRDNWRKDFYGRFLPVVKDCRTPGEACARLNATIFEKLGVKYSRRRRKPDQSPYETIESGTASCTGLSILLIDACRAVGVPARFAGIPLWTDGSGNHSWVEIWDDGWHFTGAAEPTGDELDRAWFVERASSAQPDNPRHSIYAVSFKRTPLRFPLVWSRETRYVHAVNVTERYTRRKESLEPGHSRLSIRVLASRGGDRVAAAVKIRDVESGKVLFEGRSKDEGFDANDHLTVDLPADRTYRLEILHGKRAINSKITLGTSGELQTFYLSDAGDTPAEGS